MIGILGLPWAAAAVYAGWAELYWLAGALVIAGVVLYFLLKGSAILGPLQRGPIGLVLGTTVSQTIVVAILFGIGFGANAVFR